MGTISTIHRSSLRYLVAITLGLWGLVSDGSIAKADSHLPVSALSIQTDKGTVTFQVELADTPEARRQGLMYREELPRDAGMLFDYQEPREVAMWMKNTVIPLDMLFIAKSGRIVRIKQNTKPFSLDIIRSGAPVQAVLELPAGTVSALGIEPGDQVIHSIFSNQDQGAVSGPARVIDGDTLEIDGRVVNLFNVDAPELDQHCLNVDGTSYPCGQSARFALSAMTAGHPVACEGDKLDRQGVLSGKCFVDGRNLSREMVAMGWALVFRLQKFDEDFIGTERLAEKAGNGMWRGSFVVPWDWRDGVRD